MQDAILAAINETVQTQRETGDAVGGQAEDAAPHKLVVAGDPFDHGGEAADFSPYMAPGIIALDACTGYSGIVNCIIIEDEET